MTATVISLDERRRTRHLVTIGQDQLDELHAELIASKAERLTFTVGARSLARAAMRAVATGHHAAAGLYLTELATAIERETCRARAAGVETTAAAADAEAVAA